MNNSNYTSSEVVANKAITKVYGYMFRGLILSSIMAALFAYVPEFKSILYTMGTKGMTLSVAGWVILLAPLAMIFFESWAARQGSQVMLMFFSIFSMLIGASLSSIFLVYTEGSILNAFLVTTLTFGAMSFYGYTTQKDLTSIGSFLIMALIGVIIASVVNLFFQSSMMDFIISIIAVIVFIGLTAYDTQKVKQELAGIHDMEFAKVIAIRGALSLYLDFINLFLQILKLMGQKK